MLSFACKKHEFEERFAEAVAAVSLTEVLRGVHAVEDALAKMPEHPIAASAKSAALHAITQLGHEVAIEMTREAMARERAA